MARKTVIRHRDTVISGSLAALVIAGVVLVQVMCIMPVSAVVKRHEEKVDEAVKQLEDNSKKRREAEKIEKRNADLKALLAAFDKRVPSKGEVAALFAEVVRSASLNDLKILQTQPGEMTVLGQGLYRFPYDLSLEGKYHDIARFICGVEAHASFMQVHRVNLTETSKAGGVRVNVLIYLYGSASPTREEKAEPPST
ncbi:MAG: type 4a pilus biogenesis protein PilO [Planctomycetota bacterium]